MAELLFPNQPDLCAMVEGFGSDVGNLRQMQAAKATAGILAKGGDITVDHLRRAILMMGGK